MKLEQEFVDKLLKELGEVGNRNYCVRMPCAMFATTWVKAALDPVPRDDWKQGDLLADCLTDRYEVFAQVQLFLKLGEHWVPVRPHPIPDEPEIHIID